MSTEAPERLETRERQVIWVAGYKDKGERPGSFYEVLIQAFFRADRDNKRRLSRAFPLTSTAFLSYMSGALVEKYGLED